MEENDSRIKKFLCVYITFYNRPVLLCIHLSQRWQSRENSLSVYIDSNFSDVRLCRACLLYEWPPNFVLLLRKYIVKPNAPEDSSCVPVPIFVTPDVLETLTACLLFKNFLTAPEKTTILFHHHFFTKTNVIRRPKEALLKNPNIPNGYIMDNKEDHFPFNRLTGWYIYISRKPL